MGEALERLGIWVGTQLVDPVLWPVFLGLVAAFCAAEYLTQSPAASERRAARNLGWQRHAASVFAWSLVLCWPVMPSKQGLFVAGVATLAHLLVDASMANLGVGGAGGEGSRGAVREEGDETAGRRLAARALDPVLHLACAWIAAAIYGGFEGAPTRPLLFPPELWNALYLGLALVAIAANAVAAAVAELLRRFRVAPPAEPLLLDPAPDSPPDMGRLIGILERWLVMLFVAAGQWGAVGLVMAAKSIARFQQLEERRFAEYYLIGTLASLLAAVLLGLALGEVASLGAALGFRAAG